MAASKTLGCISYNIKPQFNSDESMRPINQGFNVQFTQNRCIQVISTARNGLILPIAPALLFPLLAHKDSTTTSLWLISISVGWSTVVHGRAIHDLRQGLQQFLGIFWTSSRSRKIDSKTGWPNKPAGDWLENPQRKIYIRKHYMMTSRFSELYTALLNLPDFFPSRNSPYDKHMLVNMGNNGFNV